MSEKKKVLILAKEYTEIIKNIKESIEAIDNICFVYTRIFLSDCHDEKVYSIYDYYLKDSHFKLKDLYYAFIDMPKWWDVRAYGVDGAIYDNGIKKATIYFKQPIEKRNVRLVEWHDENGVIYRKDYYNRFGFKNCIEYINNGIVGTREFFDSNGGLVLFEQIGQECITLFDHGKITKRFKSYDDFVKETLKCIINDDIDSVLLDYSETSFRSQYYSNQICRFLLLDDKDICEFDYECGNRDLMPEALGYRTIDKYKSSQIAIYMKERKRKYGNAKAFILTETDQIEKLNEIIEALPNVSFNIGASTLMSDKLMCLEEKDNVTLYPCITYEQRTRMWNECDLYLDICYGREIYNVINEAIVSDTVVLAFDNTIHRKELMVLECVYSEKKYEDMIDKIKRLIVDEKQYNNIVEEQRMILRQYVEHVYL